MRTVFERCFLGVVAIQSSMHTKEIRINIFDLDKARAGLFTGTRRTAEARRTTARQWPDSAIEVSSTLNLFRDIRRFISSPTLDKLISSIACRTEMLSEECHGLEGSGEVRQLIEPVDLQSMTFDLRYSIDTSHIFYNPPFCIPGH